MMKTPSLKSVRLVGFLTLFGFSVIMLAISSALTQGTFPGAESYGFGIASSMLTLFLPVIVLALESSGKTVWTSWTAIELTWMFVATVFWITTGAISISSASYVCKGVCFRSWPNGRSSCSALSFTICREFQTLAVFSWFNILILLGLFAWTMTVAVRAAKKGDRFVWTSPAHAYGTIYIRAPSPAFNSDASLAKGKTTDVEQTVLPRSPSPIPSI